MANDNWHDTASFQSFTRSMTALSVIVTSRLFQASVSFTSLTSITYPVTETLVLGGEPNASGSVTVGAFKNLATAVPS